MAKFKVRTTFGLFTITFCLCIQNLQSQPFVEQTAVISQNAISRLVWGDYDNDGDLDYAVYYNNGNPDYKFYVKIFKNSGNGTFTEQTTISTTLGQITLAWGDYDNDGDLDLLISGGSASGASAEIYRNNGNNDFSKLTGISIVSLNMGAVAWCDYDNDDDLDLIITGHKSSQEDAYMKLYRNNGNSTFTEQTGNSLIGVCFSSVSWGDYDNDGDLDLLVTGSGTSVSSKIYTNMGHGNFSEQTSIQLPAVSGGSAVFGDYDNDGYLDILIAGSGICKIYHNTGEGNFSEQPGIVLTGVYSSSSAEWGDYNNDGYLDILLCGTSASGAFAPSVSKIYKNNGNGTFTERTDIPLFGITGTSNWIDYDNDGDLDILLYGSYISGTSTINATKLYRNNLIISSISQNIAPLVVTGTKSSVSDKMAILSWNRVTADATPSKAMAYNVRIGTNSGSSDVVSAHSATNGFRRIPAMGNTQLDTFLILKNLASGNYYWSVQAVDNGYMGGSFAAENIFTIVATGTNEIQNQSILIYPNPTQGLINVKNIPGKYAVIEVYNTSGTLIFKKCYYNVTETQINLKGKSKEIYMLKIQTNNEVECRKICLE